MGEREASESALLAVALRQETDVVAARQRARDVAALLGFDTQDQTRIATAASEIARNAFRYAGGGRVEFAVDWAARSLVVRVVDQGPGIGNLDDVLAGRYRSATGMGMGLAGTRRLMDRFEVDSRPGVGTRVTFARDLPPASPADRSRVGEIAAALARSAPAGPLAEVQRQNGELMGALELLREREQELLQLNRELEDTNRGVVALYRELDESVEQLRKSNATRAQFLSYMSHEFRTPLDSMIALSGLLLDEMDGELNEEQLRQVDYIRRSARDLLTLVDDLLDTARVESGQVAVRPNPFLVSELFRALAATLRPLLPAGGVELVFAAAPGLPALHTDEAKVSQILRNLVSNALKFTEAGEIRVSAAPAPGGRVAFTVADTGVGIEPEDQERIFEDFAQVESPVQRRVKGTGLGLPLSRKLAELLGGTLTVASEPGRGSVFTLTLPAALPEADARDRTPSRAPGEP